MRTGKVWARLSAISHVAFWASALIWLLIAGEAGSPLPDNWRWLLFCSHVVEGFALAALSVSVIFAILAVWRESKIPIAGVLSLILLLLTVRFWFAALNDNSF